MATSFHHPSRDAARDAASPPAGGASNRAMLVVLLVSNLLASLNQSMMNVALDAVATSFHVDLALANWVVLASNRAMLVVLLVSNLLASLNQSMMNVALDAVATSFHVDLALANWVVLTFSIVAGSTIIAAASVLRRLGLHRVMTVGYALSVAGGVLGLLSWDLPSMLAARAMQAITAGLFFPIVSTAILAIAPKGRSATLLSLNSAVIGGPVLPHRVDGDPRHRAQGPLGHAAVAQQRGHRRRARLRTADIGPVHHLRQSARRVPGAHRPGRRPAHRRPARHP